ncbi:MAG: aminotransferase class V-fold PLP-dependent enzyme [Planctomyces sp.]|nr:aminotransferase class V-fold PLP-dependent enzyme [Planctomyces sp.]
MRPLLYLDTARLGQTLPAARDAQIDFVRLTAEEPSTLYFEEFLRHGYNCWPNSYQSRFTALRTWGGIRGLKQSLHQLAGAPEDGNVLLASRSLSLVQLVARSMFQTCRHLLTTDLSWPTYQDTVSRQALAAGAQITTVPLRDAIFRERWTAGDVAAFLARLFAESGCDGLFLPAVDHLGVRIPVRAIVEQIRNTSHLQFVLVDAAQAFCHVPIEDSLAVADFVVTGCHKWMRAGQPMGVGFFGRNGTQRIIRETLQENCGDGCDLDPLLIFTEQLDGGHLNGHSETVNLAPLFSARAAAVEQLRRRNQFSANADDSLQSDNPVGFTMLDLPAELRHWIPIQPHETMRSRITLFANQVPVRTSDSAEEPRREWLNHGCVVTGYDNGWVRVSPPQEIAVTSSVPMRAMKVPQFSVFRH